MAKIYTVAKLALCATGEGYARDPAFVSTYTTDRRRAADEAVMFLGRTLRTEDRPRASDFLEGGADVLYANNGLPFGPGYRSVVVQAWTEAE